MKKFNPVVLPYLGAAVQAVLFGLAGYRYFSLGMWGAAVGIGVGVVVNFSMAIASSRISDIAKSRKLLAYVSLVGLFCLSPVIINSSLGWSLANISWSLAADLSILLTGSTFGGSLIAKTEPEESKPKRTKKPAEPDPEPVQPAFVCSCGAEFRSQPALNAHQRKHKQIIGYTASFEPITSEKIAHGK